MYRSALFINIQRGKYTWGCPYKVAIRYVQNIQSSLLKHLFVENTKVTICLDVMLDLKKKRCERKTTHYYKIDMKIVRLPGFGLRPAMVRTGVKL